MNFFDKRTLLIFVIPVFGVYAVWFVYMTATGQWPLFGEGWYMILTMVFGSFIAGASSEGGGTHLYRISGRYFKCDFGNGIDICSFAFVTLKYN